MTTAPGKFVLNSFQGSTPGGGPSGGESYSFHGGGSNRPPLPLPTMFSVRILLSEVILLNKMLNRPMGVI